MSLSQLVFRSMLKNMKQYFLYFFALIFSVTLYFSFVTLQYNQAVIEQTSSSGTASAGFEAATYMLYFIVLFFVLYANHLFIKRRSKEIGMYQLIGMTKGLIFRLIALENVVLFAGAVLSGMVFGFLSSRLFAMILLKLLEQNVVVEMTFSKEAVIKTAVVFVILLIIILIQMAWMIRRVTLLNLFTASKQADERVKRFSPVKMVIGAIGIGLIAYGYYASTKLFDINTGTNLLLNMLIILATTIGGTFLIFRFSVSFVLNLLRLKKNGHLSTVDVVAVTPIMHRMKGNAKSLTLITVLTAVSLGITTLSYIAYYSVDAMTETEVPADYIVMDDMGEPFFKLLEENKIDYEKMEFNYTGVSVAMEQLLEDKENVNSPLYGMVGNVPVIKIQDYQQLHPEVKLEGNEAILTSYGGYMAEMFPLQANRDVTVSTPEREYTLHVKDIHETVVFARNTLLGGGPVFVVTKEQYKMFEEANKDNAWSKWSKQTSINLVDQADLKEAEAFYLKSGTHILETSDHGGGHTQPSQETVRVYNLRLLGVTIFTTAFLGLAFLLATCSILYFKQMAEADDERASYTVLRKIGFSEQELMRGIYAKQLFNFGVPLLIGLLHSYFAVKSGWFLFGSELLAPMLITMALYIVMYIVFALLSVSYYRKVIRGTL